MSEELKKVDNTDEMKQAEASLTKAIESMRGDGVAATNEDDNPPIDASPEPEPSDDKEPGAREETLKLPAKPERAEPEFVKTDDPKIQERFDYFYRQIKNSDKNNELLRGQNQQLTETLESVLNEVAALKADRAEEKTSNVMTDLKRQIKDARDLGNDDLVDSLQEKLDDLRLEQKLQAKLPAEKPKAPQKAAETPEFDTKDVNYVKYIQEEKDDQGNLRRPYLQDWHPDFDKATLKAAELSRSMAAELGRKASLAEIMDRLHKEMSPAKEAAKRPQVLSSESPQAKTSKLPILTDEEKYIARRMRISEEAYARQKAVLSHRRK